MTDTGIGDFRLYLSYHRAEIEGVMGWTSVGIPKCFFECAKGVGCGLCIPVGRTGVVVWSRQRVDSQRARS